MASPARQMETQSEAAAELLKAMANPQRLRVLCLLIEREMSVGEINALVPLSQSALSQHLAKLRAQGIVKARRDGQSVRYSLADANAAHLVGALRDLYCGTAR